MNRGLLGQKERIRRHWRRHVGLSGASWSGVKNETSRMIDWNCWNVWISGSNDQTVRQDTPPRQIDRRGGCCCWCRLGSNGNGNGKS